MKLSKKAGLRLRILTGRIGCKIKGRVGGSGWIIKFHLRIPCFELLMRYVISNTFLVSGFAVLSCQGEKSGNGDLEVLTQGKVTNESLWDSSLGVVTKDPRIDTAEVRRAKKCQG